MKALVTGGAGFIGSHLVERLLDEGHQVIAVDDLSHGSVDRLDAALGRYGFLLRVVDLLDSESLSDCFTGVDWVFHLAGAPEPAVPDPRPRRRLHKPVEATLQVLECARQFGVKAFVRAGSASVYGLAPPVPAAESAPRAPGTPFAVTECLAEDVTLHWGRLYGFPACSLRLFHVYGAGRSLGPTEGSVVSVFLAQRAAGAPLTLAGDGAQTRDFVHVDDVTRALVHAAELRVGGEALNLGSGRETSIRRIAELVGGPVESAPARPGEPRRLVADLSRAHERLEWEPEIRLEDGIQGLLQQLDRFAEDPVWTVESLGQLHDEAALRPRPPAPPYESSWPTTPPAAAPGPFPLV